ncbi:unnamed protein product, partial [Timema podura]|nr:unnamed protein product [Timema podura]
KFLPTETCFSSLKAPIKWLYLLIPGNGYIPTSSLREILMALDDQLTPDQLDEMIAEIDTDGSGTVDFDGERFTGSFCPFREHPRIHGNDDGRLRPSNYPAEPNTKLFFIDRVNVIAMGFYFKDSIKQLCQFLFITCKYV